MTLPTCFYNGSFYYCVLVDGYCDRLHRPSRSCSWSHSFLSPATNHHLLSPATNHHQTNTIAEPNDFASSIDITSDDSASDTTLDKPVESLDFTVRHSPIHNHFEIDDHANNDFNDFEPLNNDLDNDFEPAPNADLDNDFQNAPNADLDNDFEPISNADLDNDFQNADLDNDVFIDKSAANLVDQEGVANDTNDMDLYKNALDATPITIDYDYFQRIESPANSKSIQSLESWHDNNETNENDPIEINQQKLTKLPSSSIKTISERIKKTGSKKVLPVTSFASSSSDSEDIVYLGTLPHTTHTLASAPLFDSIVPNQKIASNQLDLAQVLFGDDDDDGRNSQDDPIEIHEFARNDLENDDVEEIMDYDQDEDESTGSSDQDSGIVNLKKMKERGQDLGGYANYLNQFDPKPASTKRKSKASSSTDVGNGAAKKTRFKKYKRFYRGRGRGRGRGKGRGAG